MSEGKSVEIAVVVGVGPGLGAALSKRFAEAGMRVALVARSDVRTSPLAQELDFIGDAARAYRCDATKEADVRQLFEDVRKDLGEPDLVVYNVGSFSRTSILETGFVDFEDDWKSNCFGGFLVGREAARIMVPRGSGTILFTGASASLRGGAGFANLAVGKFGLRALAQSMARELQPKGVHVAHVVIDGMVLSERSNVELATRSPDSFLSPDAVAGVYYDVHRQKRSAWTLEIDLRPWVEKF